MKTRTHADHIHHAAILANIHLQKIIDKALDNVHSLRPTDGVLDFNRCYTLSNCLNQLQTQLPAPAQRVFIQAAHQFAIELDHDEGTAASETLKGILELLQHESASMPKVAVHGKAVAARKSAKPVAA